MSRSSGDAGKISTASKPCFAARAKPSARLPEKTNGPPALSGTSEIVTADFISAVGKSARNCRRIRTVVLSHSASQPGLPQDRRRGGKGRPGDKQANPIQTSDDPSQTPRIQHPGK